ncbi:MAG: carboxypeptidase regulatory-like domain-containing protein [Pedobacter sp.]|nr:MAG: carboxypeptidase regulatory-like domain-containing protein [Pedobacter sp.]
MNLKKIYFILLLLFTVSFSAFSQSDTTSLETIVSKSVKLANDYPFEKVYLHFDKPYYAIGDTVWFKAYITIDVHQPSPLSKVVYVDVISSKDSLVQTLKLQVTAAAALGNIVLSSPLYKQGNYRFRAYTNWMRNFDAAYFFNKTIAVGNVEKQISTNISVSGITQGNNTKVTAQVSYKDPTGKPYANKKVSWKVLSSDDEKISNSKGTTDANGILTVSFSTNKTSALNTSTLTTEIDYADYKSLTNTFSLKHAADKSDIQFFPEGGDLLNGVRSKVAFKAIKPNGLGADIKGTIVDNTGAKIADITSQHLGMGVFEFTPQSGKTYKANITFADGAQSTYNLPIAREEGIVLSADNSNPQNLNFKLSSNGIFFEKNKGKTFYIVAQNGQTICYAARTVLNSNIYSAAIPKTKFPSGVLKLTLFSGGQALSERIVLIQRNDLLNITMKTPQTTYTIRDKVVMNVTVNKDQKPVEANMSVTVIDETKVPFDEISETTILTHLLLTSDLKGYIEKPNYYFTNVNEKTIADADLLMLTQGYRRVVFKDILANVYPTKKFLPETGITITGTIRNNTGLPLAKGNLNLTVPDKNISLFTTANNQGEFKFTNLVIPDSTEVSINAKNNPNSNNLMILVDNEIFQPIDADINAPGTITNIDSTLTPYLKNAKQRIENSRVLKEVTITATATPLVKQKTHADHPRLSGLSSIPDAMITSERFAACPIILQCLQSIVPGLTYDANNLYSSRAYQQGDRRPVAMFHNGLNVEYGYFQNIPTSEIESIEFFRTDGQSGINRMSNTMGVLVVNSKVVPKVKFKKEDFLALLRQNSAVNITPRGYAESRVFYSPKYEVSKASGIGGDLRTTIFWNPNVLTDTTGNATFQFYNADGKGSYRAIIEGIDSDGNIGRTLYRYKVQ